MALKISVVKSWIDHNIEQIGCCQDVAEEFHISLETLRKEFARN